MSLRVGAVAAPISASGLAVLTRLSLAARSSGDVGCGGYDECEDADGLLWGAEIAVLDSNRLLPPGTVQPDSRKRSRLPNGDFDEGDVAGSSGKRHRLPDTVELKELSSEIVRITGLTRDPFDNDNDDSFMTPDADQKRLAIALNQALNELEELIVLRPLTAATLMAQARPLRQEVSRLFTRMRAVLSHGFVNVKGASRRVRVERLVDIQKRVALLGKAVYNNVELASAAGNGGASMPFTLQERVEMCDTYRKELGVLIQSRFSRFPDVPPPAISDIMSKLYPSAEEQIEVAKWNSRAVERLATKTNAAVSPVDGFKSVLALDFLKLSLEKEMDAVTRLEGADSRERSRPLDSF